jgi:putative DNA primase/helicase
MSDLNQTEGSEDFSVQENAESSSFSSSPSFTGRPDVTGSSQFVTNDESITQIDDFEGEKDSQIAERLALALGNVLCFDDVASEWYSQRSGLWRPISKRKAQKIIMKHLRNELPDGYTISKLNAMEQFLSLILLLDEWTKDKNLLPLKNGVLDIKNRTLVPYQRSDRFNWQLPYSYDSDAKIQVIDEWLRDATGNDPEQIKVIRAFAKIAIAGGEVQKFLELIGRAGTGKSTLVRLLVSAIGKENQITTDLKNLEANRFEGASLYGKRLAVINDSSRYGGEVANLKALTGGDPIRFEKKNQQQGQSFVFDGVVVIVANEPIQTTDYSSGLIRRRMPVSFNRQVNDQDKAKWLSIGGIERAMTNELSGFLNWVLDLPDSEVRLAIGGINGQMTAIQRNHLVSTNKLAAWIDENCIAKQDVIYYVGVSTKSIKDQYQREQLIREKLYSNYEQWCLETNINPIGHARFTEQLIDVAKQCGLDVSEQNKTSKGKPIRGLAIRNDLHTKYPTPITKQLLSDEQCRASDETMTSSPLDSDVNDEILIKTHSEIKTTIQTEVF